jgi:hypothetical protein
MSVLQTAEFRTFYSINMVYFGARGSVVEALCYKPKSRGFDSR